MSIIGSNVLAGASGSGVEAYEIEQSLRLNKADTSYVNKVFSSAGDEQKFTISFWFKICQFGKSTADNLVGAGEGGSNFFLIDVEKTSVGEFLRVTNYTPGTGYEFELKTNRAIRDPSAWMHLVLAVDTTQATASNRAKVWLNGVQETSFATENYPSQNGTAIWWGGNSSNGVALSSQETAIGRRPPGGPEYANAYIAEFNSIDGQYLTQDDFGEYDDNGVWRPIQYTGTYTGNSFYLKFDASDVDGDSSGLSNDFTANNITTSGTGTDVMSDTPTNNWCTLNPLNTGAAYTLANGNLDLTSTTNWDGTTGTFVVSSGKWYYEFTRGSGSTGLLGWCEPQNYDITTEPGDPANSSVWRYRDDGTKRNGESSGQSYGATWTTAGDTIGCELDLDAGTIAFYKNGISQGTAYSNLSGKTLVPVIGFYNCTAASSVNFGQREFANPPGTVGATEYFNTITWTGNGSSSSREITGCGFQPDLVWIKGRSVDGSGQRWQDVVRGAGKVIQSNSSDDEFDDSSNLGAFTSDGFTLTTTGSSYNQSSATYVAWCWKAGGSASANTDGTLESSVSANNDAGFSVCTYTGAGGTSDFGHGLSSAPDVVIIKNRSDNSTNWNVFHTSMGNTKYINLSNANGAGTTSNMWNDTSPTDSVVHIGSDNTTSGKNFVAYCWTEKTGVSKFGSYTGNGSSDGPVVSCGFRPAMVMIKWYESVNSSESWHMYDNKRGGNPNNTVLFPDATADEESPSDRYIQFTSDGFQLKSSGQAINRSGAKFIFMAWAATFTASDDFKALNTANLPEPEIKDGSKQFNTVLYTGTGTTNARTDVGFQPDLVWIKERSGSDAGSAYHALFDAVRGNTKALYANDVDAEVTGTAFSSFDSSGFTLGLDTTQARANDSGDAYVAWNWLAGNGTSSNTNGSITSTVSVNATAGFSIVAYTGDGDSAATVGHGLGVAPNFVLVRRRTGGLGNWQVGVDSIFGLYEMYLNTTDGITDGANEYSVTSTVIDLNSSHFGTNTSGSTYVAYCFANVEGYSKFDTYTGNGSSDGVFVHTGMAPAFILVKNKDDGENWLIFDTTRKTFNENDVTLSPNVTSAEVTGSTNEFDILSNGFKARNSSAGINKSGQEYIYAAFAEHPFGGSGVSPATAR